MNGRVLGNGMERTAMSFPGQRTALAAAFAAAALLLTAAPVRAQETSGRITGRVTDMATSQPLAGMTVILQGQQGEDATLTDDAGQYTFVNLPVGKYVVRFYNASSSTKVERPDLVVSAGATLRADAAIPSQTAVEETYVIKRKAVAVDVGTARLGLTIDEDYMQYVPTDRTFGDLILKAPGAFLESSGSVSIAGASGLENVYVMNGLNVTGLEYGDIMNRRPESSGGSNLSLDFIKEMQINTGGYAAESGGAMGGVINVVTKSGSNEFHGSAFMYWAPHWLSGDPKLVLKKDSGLVGVDKPDYDTTLGFELGGPILKNKLFFWVGFAPRHEKSHFFLDVVAQVDTTGPMGEPDGVADVDANNNPITVPLLRTRTRQLRQSYQYGGKIDYLVAPDHKLTVSVFGTPTSSRHVRTLIAGGEAVNDPRWAEQDLHKNNTDYTINWVSQLMDRRLRLDASAGLHRETYGEKSPYADLNQINQQEWHGGNLYELEGIPGCAPRPASGTDPGFANPCPVDNYHNGGYGQTKSFEANRWAGDIKATFLLNRNEIKLGIHGEYNTFDQTRYYTGPIGNRVLVQNYPGQTVVWNFFSLPQGRYPFQFTDGNTANGVVGDLATAPFYQDQLVANVKSVNTAYFAQDTIRPLPNLTMDLGIRYENQRLYDYRGDEFLSLDNWGPRFGVVYDPTNEGRSKVFAHYGRFFETIPMNLAARYFGGEGILQRAYDNTACTNPPANWKGAGTGEWDTCPAVGAQTLNAGANYPVQPNIKGQYHDEIVAGFQRALTDDLVVGADYTHRWLGAVVEDGFTETDFSAVLANPGQIPKSVLDNLDKDIANKQVQIDAAATPEEKAVREGEKGLLESKRANLAGLAKEPKAQRTYDAITLSARKRLANNWMLSASYTYSRLFGNYNGLYDADFNYFAPNGGNAYDTPELTLNRVGPLANDRPHSGRVDGYYRFPVGRGSIIAGLSFSAFSGVPRNYVGALIPGQQLVFLLPRGAAGRTPTVTQTDAKIAYRRELSKTTAVEAFLDLYNLFNERTALQLDDNYTFDPVAPIVNGSKEDLKYAINIFGTPVAKNPNFGQGTVFQQPFHGRIGLRFLF
ncbi:MAG: carboxypeptidase regulatory-like domain-containing protein [Bacteroidota bacterium]